MHILVIGGSAAGVCTAKHILDAGLDVTIYEKSNKIGGTWIYTDEVDCPETGVKVHSSMYHNLKINIPKETSHFPDLPFPDQDASYITQEEMLKYIRTYSDKFNITNKITFLHNVIRVTPYDKSKWEVIVHDIKQDKYIIQIFDAVMVCNGHFHTPYFPPIPGFEKFKGKIVHSHNFRRGEAFKGQTVCVVSGGPSGRDIALSIAKHAKYVALSHHLKETLVETNQPKNIFQKSDVIELTEDGAQFSDGTVEKFDAICYCTGFLLTFPFLSVDCEVTTDNNYIRPLYKHIININKPTMAFIGLPFYITAFPNFDLQSRFILKFWTGDKTLPSRQEMLDEMSQEEERRKSLGMNIRQSHILMYRMEEYFDELASIGEITPIKPNVLRVQRVVVRRYFEDFVGFRNDRYRIIDDENFIRITNGVEYQNC